MNLIPFSSLNNVFLVNASPPKLLEVVASNIGYIIKSVLGSILYDIDYNNVVSCKCIFS